MTSGHQEEIAGRNLLRASDRAVNGTRPSATLKD
jgi:hypothetical protein